MAANEANLRDLMRAKATAMGAIEGIIAKFNGMEGFVEAWKTQYDATEPGSMTRGRQLSDAIGLLIKTQDLGMDKMDLDLASQEDLERAMESMRLDKSKEMKG